MAGISTANPSHPSQRARTYNADTGMTRYGITAALADFEFHREALSSQCRKTRKRGIRVVVPGARTASVSYPYGTPKR